MAIVLKRLHSILEKNKNDSSAEICGELPKGSYATYIEKQPTDKKNAFFRVLVEEDASLVLEYNALRSLLEKTLLRPSVDEAHVICLVKEALDLANLIEKKYNNYINERPNLRKSVLQAHQLTYREWLNKKAPDYTTPDYKTDIQNTDLPFVSEIRARTENGQPYRLSFIRARRLLRELIPIINNFDHYGSWILWADEFVAPFVAYLGIVFFVPRLLCSLLMLWNSVPDYSFMTPEEQKIWYEIHYTAQWERLWPNITNDVAWVASGILMCFVCIGSLQPMGLYLTFVMQLYDAVMSCLRNYVEQERLNHLLEQYRDMLNATPDDYLVREYLTCLETGVEREKTLLYLSLVNFFGLLLAAGLSLPMIVAVGPLFPVIGAIIALGITAINFGGRSYLTQQDPHWLARYIGMAINALGWDGFTPPPADGLDQLLKKKEDIGFINESSCAQALPERNQNSSVLFKSASFIANTTLARSRSFPPDPYTQSPRTIAVSTSGELLRGSPRLSSSPRQKCEKTPSTDPTLVI